MAFEKIKFAMKTWKDAVSGGTPITAAELNRIEKGISDTAKGVNDLGDSVSRSGIGLVQFSYTASSGHCDIRFSNSPIKFFFCENEIGLWDDSAQKTIWSQKIAK